MTSQVKLSRLVGVRVRFVKTHKTLVRLYAFIKALDNSYLSQRGSIQIRIHILSDNLKLE